MNIKPLNDSVIFQFLDTITGGSFATKTKSGIILTNKNTDENSQKPRWGKVFAVGPDVKDVKEGDYIFDPLDPMCPVQVDWPAWLIAKDKFGKRNPPFVRRTFEVDEEDGCLA